MHPGRESGKARNADWQAAGQGWSFVPPCAAAMETDPTKLGTMKLMGTFGVPSYTSFGDEYMKKIGAAHRFRPSCSAPAG